MDRASGQFREKYCNALRDYLTRGDEESLLGAYELGREAVTSDVRLLELAGVHCDALLGILVEHPELPQTVAPLLGAAGRFLRESLSPFEMFHMRDREVSHALREMNRLLEDEARRIAHALHDQASTLLAMVNLDLADLARSASGQSAEQIARITAHLDELRGQLRRLSHEVRPPMLEVCGLAAAIQFLAKGVTERTGVAVTVHDRAGRKLPESIKTTVYRVVQEALNNVTQHARATQVDIRLWKLDGKLQCSVRDNGCGFDTVAYRRSTQNRGLGLIGMKDRIRASRGSINIKSWPGRGTMIQLSVPAEEGERR